MSMFRLSRKRFYRGFSHPKRLIQEPLEISGCKSQSPKRRQRLQGLENRKAESLRYMKPLLARALTPGLFCDTAGNKKRGVLAVRSPRGFGVACGIGFALRIFLMREKNFNSPSRSRCSCRRRATNWEAGPRRGAAGRPPAGSWPRRRRRGEAARDRAR